MRRWQWLVVVAALIGQVGGLARGGTISMQVSCQADGTNLLIRLENRGDEAAQNVSAHVVFQGSEFTAPAVPSLPPMTPVGTAVGLQPQQVPGTFPAVVTVTFEDLNAYPFSSVTILPVRVEPVGTSRLVATLTGGKVRGRGVLKGRVRNDGDQPIVAAVRVVTARELVAEAPVDTLEIPAKGQSRIDISLENFSAMPASRYVVHLLLEYDQDGRHFTTVATVPVQMFPRSPWQSPSFWVVLAVALVVIVISIGWGRQRAEHKD